MITDSHLYDAMEAGDIEKVRAELDSHPELATSEHGSLGIPYLHAAASSGLLAAVELLVERGANLEVGGERFLFGTTVDIGTPLAVAAEGGHLEIVKYLVEKGASFKAKIPDRDPLFCAIKRGHVKIVRYLLEAGVDAHVTYREEGGNPKNALSFAYEQGKSKIVELLKQTGCSFPEGIDQPVPKPKKRKVRKKPVDFARLRRDIREATRRTFTALRSACSGEEIYAFALFSHDDADAVAAAANTEGWFRHCLDKLTAKPANAREPYMPNYFRWAYPEWMDIGKVPAVAAALSAYSAIDKRLYRSDYEGDGGFVRFKARVFASMVLGLLDLVNEGFFGTGKERDKLTLLCSVADSWCAAGLEDESARRLNSRKVYRAFHSQWITYMAEDFKMHKDDPGDLFREFTEFLDSDNSPWYESALRL